MIEETGTVIAESGDHLWVQTIQKSTCSGCSARHGCGQGVLARLSDGRANQLRVRLEEGFHGNGYNGSVRHVRVGDQVVIGIEESLLLRASFLVYGLPLLTLVLGALFADQVWPGNDLAAIAFAAAGLTTGFVIVRLQSVLRDRIRPVLLRRATTD